MNSRIIFFASAKLGRDGTARVNLPRPFLSQQLS